MESEPTVGMTFEEIADQVALARSRALMGEREAALELLLKARRDYIEFREVLDYYPGSIALRHAMESALNGLCGEEADERDRHMR